MFNKLWNSNIFSRVFNESTYVVIRFLKAQPFITDGAYLGVINKEKEVKLNKIELKQFHDHSYDEGYVTLSEELTDCDFKINTNNIYIISYNIENKIFQSCNSKINKNEFYPTYISSYVKWFVGEQLHFERFGNYIDFSSDTVKSEMYNLPIGSTQIITAATDHNSVRKIIDELISMSVDKSLYTNNPYYRFLKNIILNPDNNYIYIKLQAETKVFSTHIDELLEFSNASIRDWQQTQIKKFIKSFFEFSKQINSKSELEFMSFIKIHLLDSEQNFMKSIIFFQEQMIPRYKEHLLFNLVSKNNIEKIEALLNSDINIDCTIKGGVTPLHLATTLENEDAVRLLIKHNANIEATTIDKITPLMISSEQNSVAITKLLLDNGANPDTKESHGYAALFFAVQKHSTDTIELLANNGANFNLVDNDGNTPFTLGLERGDLAIIKLFLSYAPNLQSEEYILYKQSHVYIDDIYNEVIKFETSPIEYILENNHNTTKAIKAFDNLKNHIDTECIGVHTSKIQGCLYELKTDELYDNLIEICFDNNLYDKASFIYSSNCTIDIFL